MLKESTDVCVRSDVARAKDKQESKQASNATQRNSSHRHNIFISLILNERHAHFSSPYFAKFHFCPHPNFRASSPIPTVSSHSFFSPRSDMDTVVAGQSLYPLHRCKTLHLVRHAQGVHNVEGEKNFEAYKSYDLFDAHLTPLGWKQVDNLREHVNTSSLSRTIELVIVSPLLRTMQTAVGVFGGEAHTDEINVPPLMNDNVGDSDRHSISSLNAPPFIAVELCREHLGVHPCDKRRSITEYRKMFPAIDFALIENDEDTLWEPDIREKNEEVAARGLKFLEWLWTRKENEIAVVTHSGFLYHTLSTFGNDCHPTVKSEICTHFANCELRSMVIVDRGMIGSAVSSTNYPGKIPFGLDLPSDVADEKHPANGK